MMDAKRFIKDHKFRTNNLIFQIFNNAIFVQRSGGAAPLRQPKKRNSDKEAKDSKSVAINLWLPRFIHGLLRSVFASVKS